MTAFKVAIDITKVKGLSDRLSELDAQAFRQAATLAVNQSADDVYQLVRPRMAAAVNLSEQYIGERIEVKHSSGSSRIEASIVAKGSKPTMTQLARYNPKQITTPAKRAKGDARRGILPGTKQAGVSVEVIRGQPKIMPGAFLIPLNNSNGWGVATRIKGRTDRKGYKVRYGPSVYQLFRVAADNVLNEAGVMLEEKLIEEVMKVMP